MLRDKIKFISLFAGIGGFDLGFERAEMECVAQVEIDEYCQKVLAKHWPDVRRFSDVREFGKHNAPPADLICGGFPCQPHSVAGKQRGAADDRDLWPEYRRVIEELKPRWVVAENVPGIRSTILDQTLSDLEGLGYETRSVIIPAVAFNAPHRRDRLFIVAYAEQERCRRWSNTSEEDYQEGRLPENRQFRKFKGIRVGKNGSNVVDTEQFRCGQVEQPKQARANREESASETADCSLTNGRRWWEVEPDVGRVADGVPFRVDRIRALGNAVVPQVAEFIGRLIVETEAQCYTKT